MKKLLRNLSMLTLLIIGGVQMAWAQETTVVYGRALTEDLANGYTAWSANDVGKSGTNVWIGNLTYNATYGLHGTGTGSRLSTLTFNHSENAIQTFEIVFDNLGNTGHDNNYSYLKIGSQIEIRSNQQKQNGTVIINGVENAISNCNQRNVNRGGDKWRITAVVNTATNTLTTFTLKGEGSKGKNASFTLAEATSLGSSVTYNTVQVGTHREAGSPSVALTSIKISEQKQTVQEASYTINYLYNSETIKTENGTTAIGNIIKATSPIKIEGNKYYAVDGAKTSLEVTNEEANNVLNVELRAAHEYNYTVKNNFDENITTGVSIEDEKVYAVYPKYKNVDGTLYETPKGNDYYQCSFVPTSDNYVHNITYSATDIKNVVYYSEAEDIEGLTGFSDSNADIRCSNGKAAYNAGTSPVTIATLTPGNYKLYTSVWGNSGTTITFKAGDNTILEAETKGYIQDYNTGDINVIEETAITVEGGAKGKGFDYVYIVKVPVTISLLADYTYSTFSSNLPLNFTGNEAVEAYIAYGDGEKVILKKVNTVPDKTGLILKKLGDATTATVPVMESLEEMNVEDFEALNCNSLVAVLDAPISAETLIGYGNAYILEDDYKFSKVVKGATGQLAVGKAYLEYDGGPGYIKIFDGEATAIKGVEVKAAQADNAIYNLQGVRVSKPTAKGLYIINGKKHLCK